MNAEAWRLIDTGPSGAFFNMALDEAIARTIIERGERPTLRLYGWNSPSVTLGRFQRASDIDSSMCSSMGIHVVRRPTGGRAILHGDELTYSFSAPTDRGPFSGDLLGSYRVLSSAFLSAFRSLGLPVEASSRSRNLATYHSPLCFNSTSFGELTIRGRKIIGSAQRRWPGGMLQQGSIPFKDRPEEAAGIFRNADDGRGRMMGLSEADGSINRESLRQAIISGFTLTLGIAMEETEPSREELDLAARLEKEKYRSPDWNQLR